MLAYLSFRENYYLFVFLIMAGMLCTGLFARFKAPVLRHPSGKLVLESVVLSTMVYMVFIFLKPVSQFIYFQF